MNVNPEATELQALEAEQATVEAAIKRNNGSDRDRAALRLLIQQSEQLGQRIYLLKRQQRSANR